MSSNAEKVIDFLERLLQNKDFSKVLIEDIEWAIEIIG
jgi:hypothetical protein